MGTAAYTVSRTDPAAEPCGADAVEGVEVLGVGVGEGVEVFLGGGDLGVAHPVHDDLRSEPPARTQEAWA
jgi:hypothetical protein